MISQAEVDVFGFAATGIWGYREKIKAECPVKNVKLDLW